MRLLSLHEPWATLMALKAKRIETRDWATSYRGPLAIHASKHGMSLQDTLMQCLNPAFYDALQAYPPFEEMARKWPGNIKKAAIKDAFPDRGKIVCVVNLKQCWPTDSAAMGEILNHTEREFGNYEPNRFGWITEHLFTLPEPISFTSKQGLVNVPQQIQEQIREQWRANQ